MHYLAGEIGDSDCEVLGDGLLAQPVNAWTSFAYVVVGLLVVFRAWRSPPGSRMEQATYGLIVAAVGVGSIAFHGPQPPGSKLIHDLPITAVAAFIAVNGLAAILGWSRAQMLGTLAGLVTLSGVAMALFPDAEIAITVPVVIAAIATEAVVYRRGLRGAAAGKTALRWYLAIGGLLLLGGAINALGRTDGPLCDPEALVQLHGVWHVVTAVAFGLWVFVGFPARSSEDVREMEVA